MRPRFERTIRYHARMSMSRYSQFRQVPHCSAPRALLLVAAAIASSGCVYRMPIQQGNYLDPVVIAQVKPGMTHSQVRYLLGTPMVPGAFDNSRWDYDYYLKSRRLQGPGRGHVAIFFTNNLVARVDSDVKAAPFAEISTRGAQAPEPRSAGGH
jgi:outer membrane protein assembly factor BamE